MHQSGLGCQRAKPDTGSSAGEIDDRIGCCKRLAGVIADNDSGGLAACNGANILPDPWVAGAFERPA